MREGVWKIAGSCQGPSQTEMRCSVIGLQADRLLKLPDRSVEVSLPFEEQAEIIVPARIVWTQSQD